MTEPSWEAQDLLLEARIWAMEATLRRLEKLLERRGR